MTDPVFDPILHTHSDGSVSQVVPADELRVGDYLRSDRSDRISIESIEEKPKTRVLRLLDAVTGAEDTYRARRTSIFYVLPRKAYEVRGMVDSYGACILDSEIVRDLDEARRVARLYSEDDRYQWAEIVEGEIPGATDPGFEYSGDDGAYERIDR